MGFIMAGYCPGTAVVATGSGYIDGVLTLVGVMVGSLVFGFAYPALEGFYESSSMGVVTLPGLLHTSWAVIAAAVVLVAVGSFLLAEKIEHIFAKKDEAEPPRGSVPVRNRVFGGLAAAAGLALITLALPAKKPPVAVAPRTTPIAATELGRRAGRQQLLVLHRRHAQPEGVRKGAHPRRAVPDGQGSGRQVHPGAAQHAPARAVRCGRPPQAAEGRTRLQGPGEGARRAATRRGRRR